MIADDEGRPCRQPSPDGQAPVGRLDERFSDPAARPAEWAAVAAALAAAELYWLTTMRGDGRPHVTPLIGLWHNTGDPSPGAFYFVTGPDEQKTHNLRTNPQVAVTTGTNLWAAGTDLVMNGRAERITDARDLRVVAAAVLVKYGGAWRFRAQPDGTLSQEKALSQETTLSPDERHPGWLFRVRPASVMVFGKDPHAQTRFDLAAAEPPG